jgi:hypothetical protein
MRHTSIDGAAQRCRNSDEFRRWTSGDRGQNCNRRRTRPAQHAIDSLANPRGKTEASDVKTPIDSPFEVD